MSAVLTLLRDEDVVLSPAAATYDDVGVLWYQTRANAEPAIDVLGFELPSEEVDVAIVRADGVTASLLFAGDGELLDLTLRAPIAEGRNFVAPPRTARARLDAGDGGLEEAEFTLAGEDDVVAIVFATPGEKAAAYWISETAFVIAEASEVQAICLTGVTRVAAEGGLI